MDDKINPKEHAKNNPKRRVLFVITMSELGGAQKFLSQLLNNLDLGKFECAVVAGREGNKEIKNLLPQNISYIVSKHLRRNPNILNDIASAFELKKIINEFGPDTLFLNSSKAGFIGSLTTHFLLRTTRPKTIYRIGGWTFNDPWPLWKRLFYRQLEKISAPWKDYIIVNNGHDYEQARKYAIRPRKEVVLIYNGIDPYKLDFLDKDEAKIRLYELLPPSQKHSSFLQENLIIGTIANFYKTKGLEYLIGAFKLLVTSYQLPVTLVIIGDGPECENIKSKISNLKLENHIFLAGRIPNAYRYLTAFDIFILPSVKEGFPWALLEAMSAKLPVIATAVGANPEIIENEKNGLLVAPRNPQALAQAIVKLADDEAMRKELGIQAHQTVLFKFSLDKMVARINDLL